MATAQTSAEPIYLDNQASTPCDPRVLEAMLPYFTVAFGNPHSAHHAVGARAEAAVEAARAEVAAVIGAEPREIVFTSGATESNNLAIKGVARFAKDRRPHVVSCVTEHKCVLESLRRLEDEGIRVTRLPVGPDGLIDLAVLEAAITGETALVSIMAVNNEIGVIQPLAEIGALCRARGIAFHTDAAQAVGKIPLDVEAMQIDLMSISGHKVYGPMGVGALYVRRRPRVRLQPLFDGGGQERGMRSGTLPLPLAVGLGKACAIAGEAMPREAAGLADLRKRLWAKLEDGLGDIALNGHASERIAGNLNVYIPGVEAEALMAAVPGVAVSTGSACTSASVEPSYVLRALGVGDARARGSLRIGLGRFTQQVDVDRAAAMLVDAARHLRAAARAAE